MDVNVLRTNGLIDHTIRLSHKLNCILAAKQIWWLSHYGEDFIDYLAHEVAYSTDSSAETVQQAYSVFMERQRKLRQVNPVFLPADLRDRPTMLSIFILNSYLSQQDEECLENYLYGATPRFGLQPDLLIWSLNPNIELGSGLALCPRVEATAPLALLALADNLGQAVTQLVAYS
jgi:hypothetical protein